MVSASLDQQRKVILRDLTRLERLEENHRFRAVALRDIRGAVGFIIGLATALKLKIGASFGAKILIAALVAIGFAWPVLMLALLVAGFVVFFVFALTQGDFLEPPGHVVGLHDYSTCNGCVSKNLRHERLLKMIADRRAWLRDGGTAPPRKVAGGRPWR